MEVISGKIQDISSNGTLTITAQYDNIDRFIKRQYTTVKIGLNDGRTISLEQRKCIYSLINSISDWSGELPEGAKYRMKLEYINNCHNGLAKSMFSLSDCDMTLAREFQKYLMNFVLDWGVPLDFDIFEFIKEDKDMIKHWVWACLKHKKCAVCGRKTELHHTPAIGMGYNRNEIVHEGMTVQPLCEMHHKEAHDKGQKIFDEKYHLCAIELDKELCRIYKVKARAE